MPSMYAHFVFGKNVYQKLPSDIKKIIKEHRELFFIGLHGPDIFFYYNNSDYLKKARKYGHFTGYKN